jgi:hypothetical protein
VFLVDGGQTRRIRTQRDDCSEQDNSVFAGLDATTVGVASDDQVAVGGKAAGTLELWVFDGQEQRTVLGGSGASVPDGFGSIDSIVRCDTTWCVVDLQRQVVHLVALDGSYLGASTLADTPLAGASTLFSASPSAEGPALVYAARADGSRIIAALSV